MYVEEKKEPIVYPTNLVELSDLLEELSDKYEKTDKRKRKIADEIKESYNKGVKLYNDIYSKLRGSDKKPIYKYIK